MDLSYDDILFLLFALSNLQSDFENNFEDRELQFCNDYKKCIELYTYLYSRKDMFK